MLKKIGNVFLGLGIVLAIACIVLVLISNSSHDLGSLSYVFLAFYVIIASVIAFTIGAILRFFR